MNRRTLITASLGLIGLSCLLIFKPRPRTPIIYDLFVSGENKPYARGYFPGKGREFVITEYLPSTYLWPQGIL